jgi:hypothetical protein
MENAWLAGADRDSFARQVTGMDFDGQVLASDVRVARNLQAKGAFKTLEVHGDITGQPCLYVEFSAIGAAALFQVMQAK